MENSGYIVIGLIIFFGLGLPLYKITRNSNKQKNNLRKYFEGHIADKNISKLLRNKNKININGEERVITTMFTDIRGFTTLSEKYPNKRIFKILNGYLNIISDIIIENNGTIDKYLGDGTMAFWGAPIFERNQATLALKAAYEIKKAFDKEVVNIGIGINTGPAILGNVGRENMMSYTAIGDSINLTARLEGLNKMYGTSILLNDSTKKKYLMEQKNRKPVAFIREIDKVKVYGRNSITTLHELVEFNELAKHNLEGYEWFKLGLLNYRKGDWEKAESFFKRSARYLESDTVSKTYIQRCREFAKFPPSGRWDGAISLNKF